MALERVASIPRQRGTRRRIEDVAPLFGEPGGVAVDDPGHRRFAAVIGAALGLDMKARDRGGQRGHQSDIEGMTRRPAIEKPFLIEAHHLDEPLDGRAVAPNANEPSASRVTATTRR